MEQRQTKAMGLHRGYSPVANKRVEDDIPERLNGTHLEEDPSVLLCTVILYT